MEPLISIIIPVYNVEKYLERCLKSVLHQTYRNFEILLIDDGSTDNSGCLCDDLASKNKCIRVFHQKNSGLSATRNYGIKHASGQYLFFLDSDDLIHPDSLRFQVEYIQKYNADIVLSDFVRFRTVEELKSEIGRELLGGSEEILSGHEAISCLYDFEIAPRFVSVCGKLINSTIFKGIWFPEGKIFEDEFISYRLYYKSKIIIDTHVPMYYYYTNDEGITKNLTLKKHLQEMEAQLTKIRFLKEHKELSHVYDKALIYYLKSTKWNLVESRNSMELLNESERIQLEKNYHDVFLAAKKRKLLDIYNDFDYYILADFRNRYVYRLQRLVVGLKKRLTGEQY